eukprot:1162142-Pelagomonas_calceolata.AAC.2
MAIHVSQNLSLDTGSEQRLQLSPILLSVLFPQAFLFPLNHGSMAKSSIRRSVACEVCKGKIERQGWKEPTRNHRHRVALLRGIVGSALGDKRDVSSKLKKQLFCTACWQCTREQKGAWLRNQRPQPTLPIISAARPSAATTAQPGTLGRAVQAKRGPSSSSTSSKPMTCMHNGPREIPTPDKRQPNNQQHKQHASDLHAQWAMENPNL